MSRWRQKGDRRWKEKELKRQKELEKKAAEMLKPPEEKSEEEKLYLNK